MLLKAEQGVEHDGRTGVGDVDKVLDHRMVHVNRNLVGVNGDEFFLVSVLCRYRIVRGCAKIVSWLAGGGHPVYSSSYVYCKNG